MFQVFLKTSYSCYTQENPQTLNCRHGKVLKLQESCFFSSIMDHTFNVSLGMRSLFPLLVLPALLSVFSAPRIDAGYLLSRRLWWCFFISRDHSDLEASIGKSLLPPSLLCAGSSIWESVLLPWKAFLQDIFIEHLPYVKLSARAGDISAFTDGTFRCQRWQSQGPYLPYYSRKAEHSFRDSFSKEVLILELEWYVERWDCITLWALLLYTR